MIQCVCLTFVSEQHSVNQFEDTMDRQRSWLADHRPDIPSVY